MQRLLLRIAAIGGCAAVVLNGTYHLASYESHGNAFLTSLHALASPFHKEPPALDYVLFYGSIGLCLLSATLHLTERNRLPWLMRRATELGQTSFVVFVFQFYVYFTGLTAVRAYLPFRAWWPVYLAASVVTILLPALAWHRRGYNRFLTVGYRRLEKSRWNVPLRIGKWAPAVSLPHQENPTTVPIK